MSASLEDATAEIDAAQADLAKAFAAILAAAEAGLLRVRDGLKPDVERALHAIILACAAEDLCSQRLAKAQRLLRGDRIDALLRGPALSGEGLDQSAADTLFGAHEPSHPTTPPP